MFFSLKNNGFYSDGINGKNIPEDSVKISYSAYHDAYLKLSSGFFVKSISVDGVFTFGKNEPIDPKIEFVSRAQGKASLIRAGLWQGVLSYVASIEDETEKAVAEVALNDTATWQRSSPFLNDATHALGLTDEQLDDLFLQASKIEL